MINLFYGACVFYVYPNTIFYVFHGKFLIKIKNILQNARQEMNILDGYELKNREKI
jgi:hypothetical protein